MGAWLAHTPVLLLLLFVCVLLYPTVLYHLNRELPFLFNISLCSFPGPLCLDTEALGVAMWLTRVWVLLFLCHDSGFLLFIDVSGGHHRAS